jgi:DNA-binding MarR family transcriptional regulator
MWRIFRAIAAIISVFITIVVDVMIQISPNDAASNFAAWPRFFGFRVPHWLESPDAGVILRIIECTLTIGTILLIVWAISPWLFKKKTPVEKLLKRLEIDDLIYAEFGEGPLDERDKWRDVTASGQSLIERVKRLLRLPEPVLVNLANLEITDDPRPGTDKKLRLTFSNGATISIDDRQPLRLISATVLSKKSTIRNTAASTDEQVILAAHRAWLEWGNLSKELKGSKIIPESPSLNLPEDIFTALQCVHAAAHQAAYLRYVFLLDPSTVAGGIPEIGLSIDKLWHKDLPAARQAFKAVEQKLIMARESLRGDAIYVYHGKRFPTAHEATLQFSDDTNQACAARQGESVLPNLKTFQAIRGRIASLPRLDGQATTGEMKREAVRASELNPLPRTLPVKSNDGRTPAEEVRRIVRLCGLLFEEQPRFCGEPQMAEEVLKIAPHLENVGENSNDLLRFCQSLASGLTMIDGTAKKQFAELWPQLTRCAIALEKLDPRSAR